MLLFGREPRRPRAGRALGAPEGSQHLERIAGGLAPLVVEFCRRHVDCLFTGRDLTAWLQVEARKRSIAMVPDSASRILRELRRRGRVQYQLLDRGQSLYRVTGVERSA